MLRRSMTQENPAICGAFVRAAEGTRTLDLLHGKRDLWFREGWCLPYKRVLFGGRVSGAFSTELGPIRLGLCPQGGAVGTLNRDEDMSDGDVEVEVGVAGRRGLMVGVGGRGTGSSRSSGARRNRPITAETRARIPVAVLVFSLQIETFW